MTHIVQSYGILKRHALKAIRMYDKDNVRGWAKTYWNDLADTLHSTMTVNELFCCFPYNPDTPLDDCKINTSFSESDAFITKNYMDCFKGIIGDANDGMRIFTLEAEKAPKPLTSTNTCVNLDS